MTTHIKTAGVRQPRYLDLQRFFVQKALANRYAELFRVFLKHRDVIDRVTFWGVTEGDSWLNNWPIKGRTSYPLLFDRAGQPKPAFAAMIRSRRDLRRWIQV